MLLNVQNADAKRTSMISDAEVIEDIEEDIEEVKKDLKGYVEEVFSLKRELENLEGALICEHDWQPFSTKLYHAFRCSKCDYVKEQ